MFFLWFAQNKHFKKRHKLPGQIMPFLLVIIAIFLGAFITAVNIGKVAINMTCNDNAADACALAAASHMAFIMNSIHKDSRDYQDNYNEFRSKLTLLSITIDQQLKKAKNSITLVIGLVNYAAVRGGPGEVCDVWYPNKDASRYLFLAAFEMTQTIRYLQAAMLAAVAREAQVTQYKTNNNQSYCDMLDRLNTEYLKGKEDGVKYALENNCVYPNLSASQQNQIMQQIEDQSMQEENDQIAYEYGKPASPYAKPEGSSPLLPKEKRRETNYAWQDADGNDHSMGVEVNLPKIASFELEVTKRNEPCDPVGKMVADDPYGHKNMIAIINAFTYISGALRQYAFEEREIFWISTKAVYPCWLRPSGCCKWIFFKLRVRANEVVNGLNSFKHPLSMSATLIQNLIQHNKDVMKDLAPPDGGKRIVSSKGCYDGGDVIIIAINDVKFEEGCIGCDIDMSHAGGSSSGTSLSTFGGGSLDAAIPDQHYIPRIVKGDQGCPDDTGLTIGTTLDAIAATHPSAPCP